LRKNLKKLLYPIGSFSAIIRLPESGREGGISMEASKIRVYSLDEDLLEVIFHYHETYKQYFGAYP